MSETQTTSRKFSPLANPPVTQKNFLEENLLLKEALHFSKIGIWELDLASMEVAWSEEVYRIHEIPVGTPIDVTKGINFYSKDFQPVISDAIQKAIQEREPYDLECILVTATGKEIWVRAIGQPVVENDKVVRLRGLFQDIHKTKQREEAIRDKEFRFRSIFNNTFNFIGLLEPDGTLIEANKAALDFGGFTLEQARGLKFYDAPWWSKSEEINNQLREAIVKAAKGEFVRYEVEVVGAARNIFIDFSITPIFSEEREVIYLVPDARDITDRIRLEASLKESKQKLKDLNKDLEMKVYERTKDLQQQKSALTQKTEELKKFAYVTSHDLQEPLRIIQSYLEILEEECGDELGENGRIYIEKSVGASKRMRALINDLLAYSRVTNKQNPMSETNLKEVVEEVMENLEISIRQNEATIIVEPLPVITGDQVLLRQLFQNLIGNAIKYRNEHISPQIKIESADMGDHHQIIISDNGIGIEEKYKERIFEIFQRLHSRQSYSGTGVGLAICKRIVEHHNGQIWVEPGEKGGSKFIFTLPRE